MRWTSIVTAWRQGGTNHQSFSAAYIPLQIPFSAPYSSHRDPYFAATLLALISNVPPLPTGSTAVIIIGILFCHLSYIRCFPVIQESSFESSCLTGTHIIYDSSIRLPCVKLCSKQSCKIQLFPSDHTCALQFPWCRNIWRAWKYQTSKNDKKSLRLNWI